MGRASQNPLAALRSFAAKPAPIERCDICAKPVGPRHPHLLEPASRKISCACDPCAILFSGNASGRYRRIPDRIELLGDFELSDEQWQALNLPINLAFFYYSSVAKRIIAMFPSPAGATESLLPLDAWEDLVYGNPVLLEMQPDVEALLVNRVGPVADYTRVPIDECFKLVGILRTHWRGFSGGTEVWRHIAQFTGSLRERAVNPEAASPAPPNLSGPPGASLAGAAHA